MQDALARGRCVAAHDGDVQQNMCWFVPMCVCERAGMGTVSVNQARLCRQGVLRLCGKSSASSLTVRIHAGGRVQSGARSHSDDLLVLVFLMHITGASQHFFVPYWNLIRRPQHSRVDHTCKLRFAPHVLRWVCVWQSQGNDIRRHHGQTEAGDALKIDNFGSIMTMK